MKKLRWRLHCFLLTDQSHCWPLSKGPGPRQQPLCVCVCVCACVRGCVDHEKVYCLSMTIADENGHTQLFQITSSKDHKQIPYHAAASSNQKQFILNQITSTTKFQGDMTRECWVWPFPRLPLVGYHPSLLSYKSHSSCAVVTAELQDPQQWQWKCHTCMHACTAAIYWPLRVWEVIGHRVLWSKPTVSA